MADRLKEVVVCDAIAEVARLCIRNCQHRVHGAGLLALNSHDWDEIEHISAKVLQLAFEGWYEDLDDMKGN